MERDYKGYSYTVTEIDFNSHAHVERDQFCYNINNLLRISTHTLTWSVTINSRFGIFRQ